MSLFLHIFHCLFNVFKYQCTNTTRTELKPDFTLYYNIACIRRTPEATVALEAQLLRVPRGRKVRAHDFRTSSLVAAAVLSAVSCSTAWRRRQARPCCKQNGSQQKWYDTCFFIVLGRRGSSGKHRLYDTTLTFIKSMPETIQVCWIVSCSNLISTEILKSQGM